MRTVWILLLFGSLITYHYFTPVTGEGVSSENDPSPTYDQCKPYVDAALKTGSSTQESSSDSISHQDSPGSNSAEEASQEVVSEEASESTEQDTGTTASPEATDSQETGDESDVEETTNEEVDSEEDEEEEEEEDDVVTDADDDEEEDEDEESDETSEESDSSEEEESNSAETSEGETQSQEENQEDEEPTDGNSAENSNEEDEPDRADSHTVANDADEPESAEADEEEEETEENTDSTENSSSTSEAVTKDDGGEGGSQEAESSQEQGEEKVDSGEASEEAVSEEVQSQESSEGSQSDAKSVEEDGATSTETDAAVETSEENTSEPNAEDGGQSEEPNQSSEGSQVEESSEESEPGSDEGHEAGSEESTDSGETEEASEEEDQVEPYEPRARDHIIEILGLDDSETTQKIYSSLEQATKSTLKDLKRLYENAIKPLETTYKYRDLSNRHFGDPEIFSKPLVVFMGPWSGGKSTIINWILGIQGEEAALRTGADPSPAQFNIMMHGEEEEALDGTQLAADWTFSGLQKFGQSFLDRLRGRKLPNRLLEKVNIVEIPGILEVRKQVERSFPFNDACQWFIDRADVLFLVYDPAKLDIGPETEAILDQLKGRESQVRIILNKADSVNPDELLRVQAMLVWNISPLMSSAEPPIMYAASLWDRPLKPDSPKALLTAHEMSFLKDVRDGIEKRVETRIAAARRFAVRVRNHAKMVDCYLNTYNNHRSFFSDKKKVSSDIIDHPQNYHIYEGLSTLTNISRYDLPDPETYKDFFKLNNLWNFPTLASTCSYFRGCPINKLDIAIAYDLPELLGKFRRQREAIISAQKPQSSNPNT